MKKNKLLLLILLVGFFLRAYHPLTLFQYGHDQDLIGWFVRDVILNHHLRLIGQETSSHGIFIGPYFYYLLIPFYLLTHFDPAGTLFLSIILGIFTIWSIYFTFRKIFSEHVGLVGALVYALSTLIVFTDREVDPTQPVMLWTVWFLFTLDGVMKQKKYAYPLLGILIGLIWSINLQLVILLPLVLLAQIFSKRKLVTKELVVGILIAVILNIPFVAFEVRHGFQQTKSLISSLTTNKDYVFGTATGFFPKLDRTMQLVYKNTTSMFWGNTFLNIPYQITFWVLLVVFAFLVYRRIIDWQLGIILFLWQLIYIFFFTKVSLNLSEYYINGMNIIWILVAALSVNVLMQNKKTKNFAYLILGLFVILNLYSFFARPINASGYVERKAIISEIKKDAGEHNYPCVSLSFITNPGNNLGYRYFTSLLGLKTKPVSKDVPTYSIVFPLSKVDYFDKSIGSLGLIKPDYKRYNDKTIQKACEGEDYTLTEPMFGFTK